MLSEDEVTRLAFFFGFAGRFCRRATFGSAFCTASGFGSGCIAVSFLPGFLARFAEALYRNAITGAVAFNVPPRSRRYSGDLHRFREQSAKPGLEISCPVI
jgi:hypothetical protein